MFSKFFIPCLLGGWVIAGIESPAVNDSKNTVEKIGQSDHVKKVNTSKTLIFSFFCTVKRELFKEKVRKARQRRAATTRNLSAHATLPPDISMDSYSSQIPVVNPCSGEEVLVGELKNISVMSHRLKGHHCSSLHIR